MSKTGGGGLARVPNLRVFKHVSMRSSTRRGGRMTWHPAVVPSSRRGNASSASRMREGRAAQKRVRGRHVLRGRQSSPIPAQASRVSVAVRGVRVTGKAGENGQHSGEMGDSSLWTRPSATRVWRHTQGSSGRPASDLGWGSSSKTAPGSLSTGSPAGRTPPHRDGSMYSHANVRAGKCAAAPYPSVAVRDRGLRRCCGKRMGPQKRAVPRPAMRGGWKGVRPGVRLENRTVRAGEEPEE